LNWAENYHPVIELYQTADHPAVSPKSGDSPWRVAMAHLFGGFCSTPWKTRQKNRLIDWEMGEGGRYAFGLDWLTFTTAIDDFSKLTWHLARILFGSFSLWNSASFDSI
jgi:hypothetical protein